MDANITERQVRCLWKLGRFWGREIVCPQFTNAKAFVLSLVCVETSERFLTYNLYPIIPRGVINCIWGLSVTTLFFETVGMIYRMICYHHAYYAICSTDCEQCRGEKNE